MSYVLSREAGLDLNEIEDYTACTWGDAQAERYIVDLFAAFEAIGMAPDLGRVRPDVPPPYLVYSVGSHLIIYRVNQERSRVEVLNILHPAINIERRLLEALRRMKDN